MVLAIISSPTVLSPHGFGEHTVCVRKYKKQNIPMPQFKELDSCDIFSPTNEHQNIIKYIIIDSNRKFIKLQERMTNVERGKSDAECKMWNVEYGLQNVKRKL